MPPGESGMAASLAYWFLFQLLVLVFAAYVSSHALAPGAHYHEVFRYIGATAFMGFALAQVPQSIWYQRAWGTTFKLHVRRADLRVHRRRHRSAGCGPKPSSGGAE